MDLKTNIQASDQSAAYAHLLCINFYGFSKKNFLYEKFFVKFSSFKIDTFLQTLL
jgi:hypothetical protein